jgi:hypothetical protein
MTDTDDTNNTNDTDDTGNTVYVLVCSIFGTLISLACVWIATALAHAAPVVGA